MGIQSKDYNVGVTDYPFIKLCRAFIDNAFLQRKIYRALLFCHGAYMKAESSENSCIAAAEKTEDLADSAADAAKEASQKVEDVTKDIKDAADEKKD